MIDSPSLTTRLYAPTDRAASALAGKHRLELLDRQAVLRLEPAAANHGPAIRATVGARVGAPLRVGTQVRDIGAAETCSTIPGLCRRGVSPLMPSGLSALSRAVPSAVPLRLERGITVLTHTTSDRLRDVGASVPIRRVSGDAGLAPAVPVAVRLPVPLVWLPKHPTARAVCTARAVGDRVRSSSAHRRTLSVSSGGISN